MSAVAALFRSLDSSFINFKEKVDPIIWQGRDVNVHNLYEVKIPVQAGSIIKYSFTTNGGDIEFSSNHHKTGGDIEVVTEAMRVPSDAEKINGTFKAVRDGTFHVVFDNGFSWFNSKSLSYKIALYQPSFTVADANRCVNSARLLNNTIADTKQAESKMIESKERTVLYKDEISQLESRMQALQMEIGEKSTALKGAESETKEIALQIVQNNEKRRGLCIRCLNHKLLAEVLSYLGKESGAYMACKYWKASLDQYYVSMVKKAEAAEIEA